MNNKTIAIVAVIIAAFLCVAVAFAGFLIWGLPIISGATPAPTPVPSSSDIISRLQSAGLQVEQVGPVGELPPGGVDGLKFYTPDLCDGCSSMVIVFDSEGSALNAVALFDRAAQTSEALRFHVYQDGRVLLRMGGVIDEAEAKRYADAAGIE